MSWGHYEGRGVVRVWCEEGGVVRKGVRGCGVREGVIESCKGEGSLTDLVDIFVSCVLCA